MARRKTRLEEEVEEILEAVGEVDPRLAPLAQLQKQLPPGPEPGPRCPAGGGGPAPAAIAQELEAALRRLQEEAWRRRQEAEARKAEADRLRQRLEELAQERQRLQGLIRRAQVLAAWASPDEAQALAGQAQARIEAVEAEMRDLATRLQELEADEGVRLLRQEEAARQAQEEAARKAEEVRALLRQGKVVEAIRQARRAIRQAGGDTPKPLVAALEEARRLGCRLAGNALFRAREALAGGEPAKALQEVRRVADLLPHIPVTERRPLHGVFCQAAAALAQGQPLVLLRGRRTPRGWTAPPGTLAIGTPVMGGVRVLFNLGTPWKEGALAPEGLADVQPLRAQQAQGQSQPE